jgi:hypothetical protein
MCFELMMLLDISALFFFAEQAADMQDFCIEPHLRLIGNSTY